MQLQDLMRRYAGDGTGGYLLGSEAAQRILETVGEARAESAATTILWQIIAASPPFAFALARGGASHLALTHAEMLVVAHGRGRYDLLVLDPAYDRSEPTRVELTMRDTDLATGYGVWRSERIDEHNQGRGTEPSTMSLVYAVEPDLARELLDSSPFSVVVTRTPSFMKTNVPSPPWGAAVDAASRAGGTAGVVATDSQGRKGVTSALHIFMDAGITVECGKTEAWVDGNKGTVWSIDPISDSCFIEVQLPSGPTPLGRGGVLSRVTPRGNEQAMFDGMASGQTPASIDAWTKDLPFVKPYRQLKVFTNAVTDFGDSGAALMDSDDRVVGFSFDRTGIGDIPEMSSWIWADSVFAAHGLTL